jgi:alkylhydroperoxidase family enzyme
VFDKLFAFGRTLGRILPRYRERPADLPRLLVKRPAILAAMATYETALFLSGRVDGRLKALASLKASALIGCPF